jgi:hypothetical protein
MPMARMTREEMDRYDREMMGIMNPQAAMPVAAPAPARAMMPTAESMDPMLRPEGTAGGPVVSYSLDDIRRFFGMGGRPAMSPAEAAEAAQMYVRAQAPAPFAPNAPPPPPPAPPPAAPRPPVPARRQAPVMRGLPTNEADFAPPRPETLGGVSPADMAAMGQPAPAPIARPMPADPIGIPRPAIPSGTTVPGTLPGEASTVPLRATPQQLAQAIRRFGRMELDPNSFAARYARTQR